MPTSRRAPPGLRAAAWLVSLGVAGFALIQRPTARINSCSSGSFDTGVAVGESAHRIDAFLQRLSRLQVFSGQVLIVRHDSVLLDRGYGYADRRRCIPVSPTTGFDIASLSKQFTGAAVLRLAQAGTLRLSDSLGRWLPGVPPDKEAITVEQLAGHTSGIPRELDEVDSDHYGLELDPPRDSVVQAILAKSLRFAPGSQFEYSNMGYVLLAAIVERASRRSFQDYVRSALFAPAGLTRTGFQSDSRRWPARQVARAAADLYDDGSPRERPDSWRGLGGSQIVTTARDLLDWHRALRARGVLATDPRDRLLAAGTPDYAFGWKAVRRKNGTAGIIFHAGAHPRSFGSEFRYYVALDLVVIVLTNLRHDDVRMQEDVIANVGDYVSGRDTALTVLPEVGAPPPSSPVPGRYALDGGDTLVVWKDATSALWLAPIGQSAFDLVYGQDSADTRPARAATATRAMTDSLERGRCPVPDVLPVRVRTSEIRAAQWPGQWCAWRRAGPFRGLEIVGVAPRTYSKDRSVLVGRLRFGSRVHVVEWEWGGDGFIKAWSAPDVPFPQSRSLGALTDGRFVVYDWFTARRVDIQVEGDGLDLVGPAGAVHARRLPPKGSARVRHGDVRHR